MMKIGKETQSDYVKKERKSNPLKYDYETQF